MNSQLKNQCKYLQSDAIGKPEVMQYNNTHNSICKLMSFQANSFNAKLIEKEGSLDHDKQMYLLMPSFNFPFLRFSI